MMLVVVLSEVSHGGRKFVGLINKLFAGIDPSCSHRHSNPVPEYKGSEDPHLNISYTVSWGTIKCGCCCRSDP